MTRTIVALLIASATPVKAADRMPTCLEVRAAALMLRSMAAAEEAAKAKGASQELIDQYKRRCRFTEHRRPGR